MKINDSFELKLPCKIINVTTEEKKNIIMHKLELTWNSGCPIEECPLGRYRILEVHIDKKVILSTSLKDNEYEIYDYNKLISNIDDAHCLYIKNHKIKML